ncbi:conserved hypothetical protein [Talaromyces stipitatus ATCC 10500]|uniref:FAD-binding PCMH-type domain-containing protein n=1 Tax=Talaromyces stipitatus (strain ATCC 10500 / CBS 375.48 / QM 6759 / NRRL 1006) TaxID=441959 RepID=B8M875_TALSN|nr:uncharacterized protein TSTA_032900 [Talaromyces stipitatus ATCC 10500]EED20037.1 conserved hypothetical protein [Talaromyces stipitatus ATCC 10500]
MRHYLTVLGLVLLPICCTASFVTDCAALSTLLPGKVFYTNSTVYDSSVKSYYFVEERLNPTCIVRPTSTSDVAIVVKYTADCPSALLSIKGGGHSPNIGAANADVGVTLDLRTLNAVSIQSGGLITSVGAGALWQEVYRVLDTYGLAAVGGRVATVGVGGLITGGGLSAFSPEHGFACDNVVNMELVLASGAIVNANETSHADLFAALKGGQNNFGIVTRFDIRSFQQPDYWGGGVEYTSDSDEDQILAFAKFKDPENFDPHAEIEQSFLYTAADNSRISSNNMFYTKPVVNASALADFTAIEPQLSNTMRISNTTDFAKEMAMYQPADTLAVYATTTFNVSLPALQSILGIWNTSVHELSHIKSLLAVLTFQAIPPVPPASGPQNSLGFTPNSHPERDLVLCLLSNYWTDASASAEIQAATQSLLEEIEAITQKDGVDVRYKYMNYAAKWQDPIMSYGTTQVEKLREVAAKYDPSGFFQAKVPGGFKLSRS